MPIENGDYVRLSEDQIQTALEAELTSEFGQNIDLTESSVFSTLTEVLAAVLNENQEQSIQDVYESAFIETATGDDLERVVALLGLQRRGAVHATGVERFEASGKVQQDYVIQRGTAVQTLGSEPIEFETTEVAILELIDSFEDGSLGDYSGDTDDATVVSEFAYDGSNSLELAAVEGAHVYDDSITIDQGTTLHGHARPRAGTVPIFTFGIQENAVDYYQVAFDEANNEARLERVLNESVDATIDTTPVTLNAGSYYEAEIDWTITNNIGVTIKDADGNDLATLGGEDDNYQTGFTGFKSGDANDVKNLDFYTTSGVSANIRAVNGGAVGNVGANSLQSVPSPPAGVNTATNLYATGDPTYFDTDGNQFRTGQDEETDRELRERALDATSGGGSATHDAIASHLINTIEDVTSVKLFENKTEVDNTDSGGLPSHSFEAVVFGGSDLEVADAIFQKKAITARDYGGVNGTEVTKTVVSDVNDQQREITFSRPNAINVDMTLDLVVNDNYIGDDDLKDCIVQYIGGTLSDGSTTIGLGVAEDVIIDHIRDIIIGSDDTGVVAFDNSVDSDPFETTPSITTVDGIEVIEIGDVEVAQSDAEDTSITLNTRER